MLLRLGGCFSASTRLAAGVSQASRWTSGLCSNLSNPRTCLSNSRVNFFRACTSSCKTLSFSLGAGTTAGVSVVPSDSSRLYDAISINKPTRNKTQLEHHQIDKFSPAPYSWYTESVDRTLVFGFDRSCRRIGLDGGFVVRYLEGGSWSSQGTRRMREWWTLRGRGCSVEEFLFCCKGKDNMW